MKKVIVGIGIPGSGKTTVLKSFAEKNGYAYLCPDDIRAEMLGDSAEQARNKEVWEEARSRLAQALKGNTVVFDATMANPDQRKQFLEFARESGAERIDGVFVDAPLESASRRNEERERKVPADVLEQMHNWLKESPPNLEEGFDAIFRLNERQELVKADVKGEGRNWEREFGKPR